MIKLIRQKDLDHKKWDKCVDESINGLEYAKSWYLDILAHNWDALVENDYERIFPLINMTKWGISYLYQPVFTQQLGLFSKTLLTEKIVGKFLDAIPREYKFAEINLNTLNKVPDGPYRIENWLTHELDLINPYENIFRNYSSNLKRNLKKSSKAGLTLVKNIKPEEVIRLFRENRGKDLSKLGDPEYLKLSRLTYSGIYKGLITTYGIYGERNNLHAGAIILFSKKKAIFLFSGLSDEGRNSGAMAFLIDEFIKEKQQTHLTLDFEGSNDPNLARFYKSFGSNPITYPHLIINRLNPGLKILLRVYKKLKR